MHIHLPRPLHGWREFVGEVGIIFSGVLLAIGAEQTIEAQHHRSQVHDAIDKLHAENVENRSALNANVVGLRQSQATVDTDLAALENCASASSFGHLVPVGQSIVLFPTDQTWIGVRDSALLPLLPEQMSDTYFKLNTFMDLMEPGMNDLYAARADAEARVEAIRHGLRDQGTCRDAVVQLLRLRIKQDVFLKNAIALRLFNEQALRGERLDAVAKPAGLDISTGTPKPKG